MRFRVTLASGGNKSAGSFDCANCSCKKAGPADKICVLEDTVDLGGPNVKQLKGVNLDNVLEKIEGKVLWAYKAYGLCPVPIFTTAAFIPVVHLFELYNMTGGLSRIQTPGQAYSIPARYVEACRIIESEMQNAKA